MSESECNHPRKEITVIENSTEGNVGNQAPRFWTIHGHCSMCGEDVELDYEFKEAIGKP